MKTENIINLAVGGAVLFGTVWLVSKAWKKGQGSQEEKSEFRGKRANPKGFAGLNRGISPSRNGGSTPKAINCENLASPYTDGCDPSTIQYSCGTLANGSLYLKSFDCELLEGGVRNIGGRRAKKRDVRASY